MTDEEVAKYACITLEEAAKLRRLAPKHVAAFARMHAFEQQWKLHLAGLAPRPTGVLIDEER